MEGWVDALYDDESQHLFAAEKQEECSVNREQTGEGTVDLAAAVAGIDKLICGHHESFFPYARCRRMKR